jgi:hypothetical protein
VSDFERFSRQQRLAEVGDVGQARLARAVLPVPTADGADVQRAYLEGAGASVRTDLSQGPAFVHASALRFDETRAVAAGAWRALTQIRTVLGLG